MFCYRAIIVCVFIHSGFMLPYSSFQILFGVSNIKLIAITTIYPIYNTRLQTSVSLIFELRKNATIQRICRSPNQANFKSLKILFHLIKQGCYIRNTNKFRDRNMLILRLGKPAWLKQRFSSFWYLSD
jgi:hypothetical protein